MTKRATIADIAARAGLSKGAVSYALNGLPGVSESTRQRVLKLAAELGWRPNSAARALSASRAGALGLVMARPASTLGVEPFFIKLMSGIENTLAARSTALVLQVVPDHDAEVEAYRRWWAERRVDGIFLIDLRIEDKRVLVLEELGLPAVVIGGPGHHGRLPAVWSDDASAMAMAVEYLAALGHRRVARVAGPSGLLHTELRSQAFTEVAARLALASAVTVPTDYSPEQGAQATRRLLSGASRPSAVIYDNDVMAVAGLGVAHEMDVAVPERLSLLAWDDSALCRLSHPALSAMSLDVHAMGVQVADCVLNLLASGTVRSYTAPLPRLVTRGTTTTAPTDA